MEVRKRIGRNVQRLRHEKAWSQEEFAERAGIHRTYLSGLERGVRNPTATVLERIAIAFAVTIGAITDK